MTMAVGLYPLLNPLLAPAPGIVTRSGLCDRAKGRFSPSHAGSIAGVAAGHWAPLSPPHDSVSPEPWGAQRGATARSGLKNHCLLFFPVLDSPAGCCFLLPWGPRLLQPSDGHGEETGRAFPHARHGPVGSRTEEHPCGAAAFALQTPELLPPRQLRADTPLPPPLTWAAALEGWQISGRGCPSSDTGRPAQERLCSYRALGPETPSRNSALPLCPALREARSGKGDLPMGWVLSRVSQCSSYSPEIPAPPGHLGPPGDTAGWWQCHPGPHAAVSWGDITPTLPTAAAQG